MVKEILEFDLTSESKSDQTDLIKERKADSDTKKTLKSLEEQFMKCKIMLRCSQEETERVKIEKKGS